MSATTFSPPSAVAAPASDRARLSLRHVLVLAFAIVLAILLGMTALALALVPADSQGPVLAAGGAGIAATLAVARWLARRIERPVRAASESARRIAAGQLADEVRAAAAGGLGGLQASLAELQQGLFRIVSEVRTGTTSVAATASTIRRDNEALAQRTESQVSSLQQTAASMEQLASAVRQNAESAQQADTLVAAAAERAGQGEVLMDQVVATMNGIRDGSRSIAEIISLIDGIAFQTNILALNAAVEAARAGEQGRGFAVVAGEVRARAQRSAEAARQVKQLVGRSVEQVDAGGRLVDEAGRAMGEIVASVQRVAGLIGEISAASQEQSAGIASVTQAVGHIDGLAQSNAVLVEDASRTVESLHERAVGLMRCVAGFELGAREHGSAEEARALALGAREFCRAHGGEALIADVNRLGKGRFVDRDLYLMVIGVEDGVLHAHGNNLRNVGMGPDSRDADGRHFLAEMAQLARSRGEGWIEWKWAHPFTDEILTKRGYVARAGDLLVVCGIYKEMQAGPGA